ncbi:hypothetical protein [Paracoccus sp. N5]|uniref:hypothetical protein n=1 Tax=Paracoccus sp. N5 TaxID=1101189 RepID=UPI0003818CAD|nr:hypothetical protein [Paracoccus sp. N5]
MLVVWAIVTAVLALTATIGPLRAAARSWVPLAAQLALVLATARACYLIGESKTGGILPGIIGRLLCILMLFAAGALVAGAAARWLWDLLHPGPAKAPPAGHWDVWLLGAVSVLVVVLSAIG